MDISTGWPSLISTHGYIHGYIHGYPYPRQPWAEPYMLCMLKHTLFSCVYAKGVFSIHKITTACNCNKTLGLLCSKFNAAFSLKVAENYNYSYEMHKNCCHQSCSFWSIYASNRFLAGASPQTPLGELIVLLPRPPSWFRGWDPRGKGKREGRGRWDWDPSTRDSGADLTGGHSCSGRRGPWEAGSWRPPEG